MSAKSDRSIAPQGRLTRASRAKPGNHNITPPRAKPTKASKPKKGTRVMEAQLASESPAHDPPVGTGAIPDRPDSLVSTSTTANVGPPTTIDVDGVPLADPWWTPEREEVYQMTLQGIPQQQISNQLQRHRHTVARWVEDERFLVRLSAENVDRFKSSRQRRTMQTLRSTDKVYKIADKMLDKAIKRPNDVFRRSAAQSWLNEFREQSRREDEIYGLDKQRVDVNVHGGVAVQHDHKGAVDLSFKEFLTGAMRKLGVDVETEEVDSARADEALIAISERALNEGSFLEDLVEREKQEALQLSANADGKR